MFNEISEATKNPEKAKTKNQNPKPRNRRRNQVALVLFTRSCQKFRRAKLTVLSWLIVKLMLYYRSCRRCVPNEMTNVQLSVHDLAHRSLAVTLLQQQQHRTERSWAAWHILCISRAGGQKKQKKLGVFLHAWNHMCSATSHVESPEGQWIRWQAKQEQLIATCLVPCQ